mgnify:CR=1 FL=1
MNVERVFLGRGEACLAAAAKWFEGAFAQGGALDLSRVVVVAPGRRGGRRLLELLALAAREAPLALAPPRVVTPGALPELFVPPAADAADDFAGRVAWAAALSAESDAAAKKVFPRGGSGLAARLAEADDLAAAASALAAEGLRFADAGPRLAARLGAAFDAAERERWAALAALEARRAALLADAGLVDPNDLRRRALAATAAPAAPAAIADAAPRTAAEDNAAQGADERTFVLLAATDLSALAKQFLARSGARVVALVDAPADEAALFDEWGCVVPERWAEAKIDLSRAALRIVAGPRAQADAVVEEIAAWSGALAADEITVGLGDPGLAAPTLRALQGAGLVARSAAGTPVAHSRPATLLARLADWLERKDAPRLAPLVRHPDLEAWLARRGDAAAEEIIEALDAQLAEALPQRITAGGWPQGGGRRARDAQRRRAAIEPLLAALEELTSPLSGGEKPLSAWADGAARALLAVYGDEPLDPRIPAQGRLAAALRQIGAVLAEAARLPAGSPLDPEAAAHEALRLFLGRLADATVPEEPEGSPIEILGWLELALDDAPGLVIAGLNEGAVPQSASADPLLPDAARRALGLADNARRYARDAAALASLAAPWRRVALICGRQGADGEPLAPSRLLFAADDETATERAARFYEGGGRAPRRVAAPAPTKSGFAVAPPPADAPRLGELSVTAFRDYLECPFRFYLKHVLTLGDVEDRADELDGAGFGSLAHEILRRFGDGPCRDERDARAIERWFEAELPRLLDEQFGTDRRPVVDLQARQLLERLRVFARWQAGQRAEGWSIHAVERKVRCAFDVDGDEFTLVGRVDRIDRNAAGEWRVLDYKTGDSVDKPEKTHQRKSGDDRLWVDLQLPLYAFVFPALVEEAAGKRPSLGYVKVGADGVALLTASWSDDEIREAWDVARDVVRGLRAGRYWPPAPDIDAERDSFPGICLSRWPGRPAFAKEGTR